MPMQAQRRCRGIAPTHSQSGTRKRWVVSATLRPLYPRCTGGWVGLGASLGGTENLTPPGFGPCTAHPTASCYTNYAIPAARVVYSQMDLAVSG